MEYSTVDIPRLVHRQQRHPGPLGKLVRSAALYAGPDARTPDTVEGWKDVNATSVRWP